MLMCKTKVAIINQRIYCSSPQLLVIARARAHTLSAFMERLRCSPAPASRHALHLCARCGLEAYYPLISKWPHVPALACPSRCLSVAYRSVTQRHQIRA